MRAEMKKLVMAAVAASMMLSGAVPASESSTDVDWEEMKCLALNVYYETRSDSLAGQYAVSDVVLNRVASDRYPNTVCEVVHQGKQKPSWKDPSKMVMVRNMCQFSWYCDGKADKPKDEQSWSSAQMVAFSIMIYGKYRGLTEGATHYHAKYVTPSWSKDLYQIGRIGQHIFYRYY
jgi:spore germination cell wall hydrolase CwlJ-like protein